MAEKNIIMVKVSDYVEWETADEHILGLFESFEDAYSSACSYLQKYKNTWNVSKNIPELTEEFNGFAIIDLSWDEDDSTGVIVIISRIPVHP